MYHYVDRDAMLIAAASDLMFAPRMFNQNPPHCFRSGHEKVASAVSVLKLLGVN